MKIKIPNIALYALVVVAFIGLVGLLSGAFNTQSNTMQLQPDTSQQAQFFQAEVDTDKCATPAGYDDAAWKEHMSHHPERYVGCL